MQPYWYISIHMQQVMILSLQNRDFNTNKSNKQAKKLLGSLFTFEHAFAESVLLMNMFHQSIPLFLIEKH